MITNHEERLSGGSAVVCNKQKYPACLFSLKDILSCGLIFVDVEKKKEMLKFFDEKNNANFWYCPM